MEIAWAELCGRSETGAPDEHGRGVKRGKSWGELRWKERDGSADEHGRGVKHGKISGGAPLEGVRRERRTSMDSDCSGLSSDFLALKMCGIPVEGVFISEIDSSKLAMSKTMHARFGCSPKVTGNIDAGDPDVTPQVDLYVTGPPCPPYSSAGKKAVLIHTLKYVVLRRPRVLVLENVKGPCHSQNKQILDKMVTVLRNCYSCNAEVVSTMNHGLPQNRERLYLVAVQKQDGKKVKPFSCQYDLSWTVRCWFRYPNKGSTRCVGRPSVAVESMRFMVALICPGPGHTW